VCIRHGANVKRCSVSECPNQAQKGGVCIRHGANVKRCSVAECPNQVVNGGGVRQAWGKALRLHLQRCRVYQTSA
jgi:hypothetical protein